MTNGPSTRRTMYSRTRMTTGSAQPQIQRGVRRAATAVGPRLLASCASWCSSLPAINYLARRLFHPRLQHTADKLALEDQKDDQQRGDHQQGAPFHGV